MMTARILMCFAAICAFGCGTIEQSVSTSISPYDSREIEKVNVSFKHYYVFPARWFMTIEKKKFISGDNGLIYSMSKPKWKKHLKLMLAHKLSLLKKKHLPIPEINKDDIKLIAYNIFDIYRLKQDDCIDIIKSEIVKLGEKKWKCM